MFWQSSNSSSKVSASSSRKVYDLAINGNLTELKKLYDQNPQQFLSRINTECDANNMYALHHAAECKKNDVLQFLLQKGAEVFKLTCRSNTPLHIAARSNNLEGVKLILSHANDGWNKVRLLWIAHMKPSSDSLLSSLPRDMIREISKWVMLDTPDFNKFMALKNSDSINALEYAMKSATSETIRALVNPVTVMHLSTTLGSQLHNAAAHGSAESIYLLVKNRANVNEKNHRGETPIFRACCNGSVSAVKALLELGGDPSIIATSGRSPKDEAAARRFTECVRVVEEHLKNNPNKNTLLSRHH